MGKLFLKLKGSYDLNGKSFDEYIALSRIVGFIQVEGLFILELANATKFYLEKKSAEGFLHSFVLDLTNNQISLDI